MRGSDVQQAGLFSYVSPEARVPQGHPLRPIREMTDRALGELTGAFQAIYAREGRPSIPPEKLLRALLLQVLYSVRSERLLVEQLDYNLLFRWFVGLSMDDPVWSHSTFSKNRDRLIEADIAVGFFQGILRQAAERNLLSDEHFTVDGTLIEAWASLKRYRPRDGSGTPPEGRNPEVRFHGERRRGETHCSTTDPAALLYRKGAGKEARLCYMGHLLMENRNGLVTQTRVTRATGTAEREAALAMIDAVPGRHRITIGADKGYDCRAFAAGVRDCNGTPHVARAERRGSVIDGRTTRHAGYAVSQKVRKRIEEGFGWAKTVGPLRKTRFRGVKRVAWQFTLTFAGYNMVRMRSLLAAAPPLPVMGG